MSGVSVCFCSLQIVHEQCLGNVLGVLDCICMVSLDVYNVWMCLRDYLGAHPLQNGEFTPFRHSPERQYFLQLAILRHQNIKMYRYILNKNGWVLPFFSFLVSVRAKLKNTFTWITLQVQNCPPDGAFCNSSKFGHQMEPHALVANLAARWHHQHLLLIEVPG